MGSLSNNLNQLAKHLHLTDIENSEETYILTKEEEDRLIDYAIKRAKDHKEWKMKQILKTKEEIDLKLSQVEWEHEIDRVAILKLANSVKHHEIWQQEQHKKEKEKLAAAKKELEETWTAKQLFSLMKWASENKFNKKLKVFEQNKKLISALCFLGSNDERYESELNYSFSKGLLIRGASGLGKTHLVRCVEDNGLKPILILSMLEITDEIKSHGEYDIQMGNKKLLYLDDAGTEESVVNHYGTKITFFKNFIETIYLRRKNFSDIIVSTNLNFKQIEEKYGFRVASRMREMFNVVDIFGEDMRHG
jgi:DNA replication protein DnaC